MTFAEYQKDFEILKKVSEIFLDLSQKDGVWYSKSVNAIASKYYEIYDSPYGWTPDRMSIVPYVEKLGITIYGDKISVGDYNNPDENWKETLLHYNINQTIIDLVEKNFSYYTKDKE